MTHNFAVTYELITEESAEAGDAEERGYIAEDLSLRDALDYVTKTESPHCDRNGVEANDSRVEHTRWITIYNGPDHLSGIYESRSLHIPENVTPSSRRRIARLLGVRV